MSVLHVACAADRAYVPHSAAMLHSLLEHAGSHPLYVHYLHGPELPAGAARLLTEMVEQRGGAISFLLVPDGLVAGLASHDFPPCVWYRIFLPELLPDVDRVLYLDADAIVTGPLDRLIETDLGGRYLAAVTNVFQPDHRHRPAALGLADQRDYFNSGVLLMNLDLMRRDGCSEALRSYALAHGQELLWPDQDALNVVLGRRRLALHPRWNCMNSVLAFPWSAEVFGAEAVEEARRAPAIRHFEGPSINKPWHYLCDHPTRELYFEHRRQTPWPRYRLEGVTPRNVVRRLVRALSA